VHNALAMTTTLITGETWGENVDAVRAYLLGQSDEPLPALRARLETARREFRAALDGVSEVQAQFTPGSGAGEDAWGIAEVLRHIASIEPIMADRVRLLGQGQPTDSLTQTHPGYLKAVETRELSAILPLLEQSYAALLAAIDAIQGHERLDAQTPHRRFGPLNCRGWVVLHTLHLQDHTRQITRLKQAAGYPES
jgi:DinB superfamily